MQVVIRGISQEVAVTSVILQMDQMDPDSTRLYMFHCSKCGSPVIQHTGFVARILPGNIPFPLPLVTRCPNRDCKHKYRFEAVV